MSNPLHAKVQVRRVSSRSLTSSSLWLLVIGLELMSWSSGQTRSSQVTRSHRRSTCSAVVFLAVSVVTLVVFVLSTTQAGLLFFACMQRRGRTFK